VRVGRATDHYMPVLTFGRPLFSGFEHCSTGWRWPKNGQIRHRRSEFLGEGLRQTVKASERLGFAWTARRRCSMASSVLPSRSRFWVAVERMASILLPNAPSLVNSEGGVKVVIQ